MKSRVPLLVLLLVLSILAAVLAWPRADPPSVLLITIDTLRADHLAAYGYGRDTAPRLDAITARGVVFENAISTLPETSPAFASMMTGRWPVHLGIRGNTVPLAEEAVTLAELLSDAGYQTAGFVSGFPLIRRFSGLHQGFGLFDDAMPDPRGHAPGVQRLARKTTDAALAWFAGTDPGPTFAWVHYYDPHGDYNAGPEFGPMFLGDPTGPELSPDVLPVYQRFAGITDGSVYVALYDAEIRKTDAQLARLLDGLQAAGRLENTVVIVTADHGESLLEHEYYLDHGSLLYMPSVHVPLIVAGPGVAEGTRVSGLVRTPDLFATVLDAVGLSVPAGVAAVSAFPDAAGLGERPPLEAFSEACFIHLPTANEAEDTKPKAAVRDDRFTAILRLSAEQVELYDRTADPGETHDLLADGADPGLTASFRAAIEARLQAQASGRPEHPIFNADRRAAAEDLAGREPIPEPSPHFDQDNHNAP